ncbi:ILEUA inhibitor, partial [Polypterus senegalus]
MESLSEANSQFSLDLFKKLSETNSGNIFFSPLNISTALAMVLLGARGNTAAQMEQVLHFSKIKTVHSEFSNQLSSINNKDSTSALRLANRLFGEKTLIFAKDYLDETRMLYHSEIEGVDFITSSESARQNINSWVEKQTEGKKDTKSVMMMYKSAKFNYASLRDVDADIIELPYAGGDVSMFVLLPKDIEDDSTGLEQVLHLSKIKESVHSEFSNLMSIINNKESTSALHMANRLFGEKTFHFAKSFLDETSKLYQAELEGVDFISSSESARQNINAWVEKKTEGKIVNMLSEGAVDPMTKLFLKDTKTVMLMYKRAKFNYALLPDVNAQIIELPYLGGDLSMFVLLPKDIEDESTGLEEIEKQLTYENLMKWTSKENLHYTKMNLYLPRFKMEETYNLKKYLSSMVIQVPDQLVLIAPPGGADKPSNVVAGSLQHLLAATPSPNRAAVVDSMSHGATGEIEEESTARESAPKRPGGGIAKSMMAPPGRMHQRRPGRAWDPAVRHMAPPSDEACGAHRPAREGRSSPGRGVGIPGPAAAPCENRINRFGGVAPTSLGTTPPDMATAATVIT